MVRSYVPGTHTTLLGEPSKMPCFTFSIPAMLSCPAKVTEPSDDGRKAICAGCYANKKRYKMPIVQNAQHIRWDWVRECMRTPEGRDEFVRVMTQAIADQHNNYFRIHDSGDFFTPEYIRCWTRIARNLPDIKFWAPTRTWRFLERPAWRDALLELASLPNMAVRPSALHFGDAPPVIEGLAAGTTAAKDDWNCPAPLQENACGPCRACWEKEIPRTYRAH